MLRRHRKPSNLRAAERRHEKACVRPSTPALHCAPVKAFMLRMATERLKREKARAAQTGPESFPQSSHHNWAPLSGRREKDIDPDGKLPGSKSHRQDDSSHPPAALDSAEGYGLNGIYSPDPANTVESSPPLACPLNLTQSPSEHLTLTL